jgi:hypothetical protein
MHSSSAGVPATPVQRLLGLYRRHERAGDIACFAAGFLFDIVTLARVDSRVSMAQQLIYLTLAGTVLVQLFLDQGRLQRDPASLRGVWRWYFQYRVALLHFLLGALLSLYTLFFFKSSSLFVSAASLAFLVAALLANESRHLKSRGLLTFKFALLGLCALCCAAVLVPVIAGSVGTGVFLASMAIGCVPVAVLIRHVRRQAPERMRQARAQIIVPFGLVLIGFLALYLFRLIPPVPLSIPYMGVYHGVEKTDTGFRLQQEGNGWRFWQRGDQRFRAQPGDRLFVFFRIFSPARFSDQVTMRWSWRPQGGSWQQQDAIPIAIVGGREHGFRGYGVKSNYQAGDWRVQVETLDGREIGRIGFTVENVAQGPRELQTSVQ